MNSISFLLAQSPPINLAWILQIGIPILIVIFVIIAIIKSFIQIASPNKVLVVSGKKKNNETGTQGYRIGTRGQRIFRIPILEKIDEMDLTTIPINIEVRNAYSKGGIALDVQAMANIKISGTPHLLNNAIERFLGMPRLEIVRAAKDTLEGNLREVVATLTPQQINEDRLRFADSLTQLAEDDLERLGLHVDTLKIQHVSDHTQYLNSIGRQRIARILRDAEMAESNSKREANNVTASAEANAQIAREKTEAVIAQRRNELRSLKAEFELKARTEEEKTLAAAQEARAKAEQELQEIRTQLEELRLQADKVLPAEAMQQAREMQAKAIAAPIAENGKAQAQALHMISEAWLEAGEDAKDIFVIQQLENILKTVVSSVNNMQVKQVHIIDNGDGNALANYVSSYPKTVSALLNTLYNSTGIDIGQVLTHKTLKGENK